MLPARRNELLVFHVHLMIAPSNTKKTALAIRCHFRAAGRRVNGGARAIRARRFRSEREWRDQRRRRPTGRQDSYRRRFHHALAQRRSGGHAQPHCPAEPGRHARHRLQPERERHSSIQSRCRRTARFWWAASFTTASADRRATASPGSMPRPAWLIRSTRTRTVRVFSIAVQADGKILVGGDFHDSIGGQTRNHIARLDATTGLADSFNPNANGFVLCHRGAGGRQDFGGRRFQRQHRRTDAQQHRPARCHDRPG